MGRVTAAPQGYRDVDQQVTHPFRQVDLVPVSPAVAVHRRQFGGVTKVFAHSLWTASSYMLARRSRASATLNGAFE